MHVYTRLFSSLLGRRCSLLVLATCSSLLIFALSPFSLFAQSFALPFEIAPYQKVDGVTNKLKEKAISSEITHNEEGMQEVRAYNVEWRDVIFDTLIIAFTGEPEEATTVRLVRACEDDQIEGATEKLISDLTDIYGAPSEDGVEYAVWTRGTRQTIFLGRREDDRSVCASIDIESMVYRRSTTDANWPFEIPIDAPRDEIERIITRICGKIISKEEMFVLTAGCPVLSIPSRKMIVWNDEGGMVTVIEARFDPLKESDVRKAFVGKYGKQTSSDDGVTLWRFVGSTDAIRIEQEDGDLVVRIDVLALERKQASE